MVTSNYITSYDDRRRSFSAIQEKDDIITSPPLQSSPTHPTDSSYVFDSMIVEVSDALDLGFQTHPCQTCDGTRRVFFHQWKQAVEED